MVVLMVVSYGLYDIMVEGFGFVFLLVCIIYILVLIVFKYVIDKLFV